MTRSNKEKQIINNQKQNLKQSKTSQYKDGQPKGSIQGKQPGDQQIQNTIHTINTQYSR